ncbi:TIR domain-containing protein [Rhodohalobacter sp. 8-1]|uniref:TIR domain-containing protein n=1 Tax=Rhodohalobacter sp. 8-1 TaxID=3131972 RepID=UPI0030ECD44A
MATIVENRDIFIAHGWENSQHIHKLTELLDRADTFDKEFAYVNHGNFDRSVLRDEMLNDLNLALKEQMNEADVVLVMTDIYHDHADWIDKEITLAKELDLPIILIRSYENRETPPELEEKADEIVVFDPKEILKEIKNYG